MTYRKPLEERLRKAKAKRERYARDPDFRLACNNRNRARVGKPPLSSVDEIKPHWIGRERDQNGRFV